MKKTTFIIGIILAILIVNVTAVQAATATAELKVSNASVKQGETFTVTLSATCSAGINGVIADYSYDTDILELVDHKAIEPFMDLNGDSTSKIETMISTGSVTTSDIFILTFKVKDSAQIGSNVTISTDTITVDSDTEGELTVQPKSISVQIVDTSNSEEDNNNNNNNNNNTTNTNTATNTSTTNTTGTNTTMNTSKNNSSGIITNGKSSTTSTNTPAKATDKTTATSILPKTGFIAITGASLIAVIVFSVIMFKKLRKYDGIE